MPKQRSYDYDYDDYYDDYYDHYDDDINAIDPKFTPKSTSKKKNGKPTSKTQTKQQTKANQSKTNVTQSQVKIKLNEKFISICAHVDVGKSTLLGHLLSATDAPSADIDFSSLLDVDEREAERGVTMACSYRKIENLHFIDTPGHRDFIPELIKGIVKSDICVLLVDGSDPENSQTMEILYLIRYLGVRKLILGINKVDVLSKEKVGLVKEIMQRKIHELGFTNVEKVELSGKTGKGLERLMTLCKNSLNEYEASSDDVVFMITENVADKLTGKLISGRVTKGATLTLLPQNTTVKVKSFAAEDDSLVITKSDIEFISDTGFLVSNKNLVQVGRQLTLTLKVLNEKFSAKEVIGLGSRFLLYVGQYECLAEVIEVNSRLVFDEQSKESAEAVKFLKPMDIGVLRVLLDEEVSYFKYADSKKYGRCVARSEGNIIAVGVIMA
eukprot:augustus_masked-scaffold_1-processed-gene-23.16-mRNA-1 protein AED:1.00 eAED:1.00 QI:0/-1/0/0/-1/1/1/0/440